MGKMKNMYIELQEELETKAKTLPDSSHWSYSAALVQQLIEAESAERQVIIKQSN
jgi:hypothetical protein